MARKFGMVGSSVWDSEKFVSLSDDSARLAYLYLCTTHHGNSVGVFRMPPAYLAVDLRWSEGTANSALGELEDARMIEQGVEGQIRIAKWFLGPSGANSPSTGSSYARTFMDPAQVKKGPLRSRAIVEMIHSTMVKAQSWNPDTKQIGFMYADFEKLLRACLRDEPEELQRSCEYHDLSPSDTVWNTMWDTMYHTMSHTIPPTVATYIHGHLTPEKERDRDTGKGERQGYGERLRARDQAAPSPPSSPPAKGGRSGGGKVPEDVQHQIDSLGASMCPECQTKLGYGRCKACKAIKT